MFPELNGDETQLVQSQDNPIPWTYKFDWTTKQFMQGLDGRYLRTTTYAEYLEETAKKILNTRRFRYEIYSERYGVDFLYDAGRMRSGISLPAIKTQAQEALEAHSEIERAEVVDIRFENNGVIFSLEIEGMRGTTRTEVNTWQR
ncbi:MULTISPECIES: DUF2634 domain-containing protein [Brevibacillus]|uniref:DUF2634 domain-containing protein n=1 Tax=Brevibacillus TaxID=55080 RepID=UPI000D0E49CC|nr:MULTISPECIES: DUF2634 domain-containing protein [Brevibacillus]MED1945847.1 DUF2634 domain-containing protein [Brevibacillus formosus]MED2001199.1 DUF2634 domain-containing protein [Brevibacillus formosus]MED2085252.1 DUF2634 domain-containing protein [Brevibacillus formosus]PSK11862.1 DUF2634 domain-containing protein [Brevibacillus sp. NRRL NRS-603]